MKVRNLVFGFVLTILVLCAGISVSETKASAAARPYLPFKIYCTDATLTVQCGYYSFCYDIQDGCKTPFVKHTQEYCPPQ